MVLLGGLATCTSKVWTAIVPGVRPLPFPLRKGGQHGRGMGGCRGGKQEGKQEKLSLCKDYDDNAQMI